MQPEQTSGEEGSEDYGYDLVHEEVATRRPGRQDAAAAPGGRGAGTWHERRGLSGDYSYDEAHGR
jgi:hypothetical protein